MASDQLGCGLKPTAERCGINHRRVGGAGNKSKKRSQRVCPRDPGRGGWTLGMQTGSEHACSHGGGAAARQDDAETGLAHAGGGRETAAPRPRGERRLALSRRRRPPEEGERCSGTTADRREKKILTEVTVQSGPSPKTVAVISADHVFASARVHAGPRRALVRIWKN